MISQAGLYDTLSVLDFAEAGEAKSLQLSQPTYPLISLALIALRATPPVGQFLPEDGTPLSVLCQNLPDEIILVQHAYVCDRPAQWPARISIDERCYEMLKKMAFETYVPSSEQSRAAGAGAGLNDND